MKRFSLTGLLPSVVGFSKTVQLTNFQFVTSLSHYCENDYSLQPPTRNIEIRYIERGLDSSLFARRYWGNIITILFMSPTIRTRE